MQARLAPCWVGSVRIDPPLILAPMAGVTNHAFRLICKEIGGVGLVCAEMMSAFALTYGSTRTHQMIDWTEDERPVSVQIFGMNPEAMAEAARLVEESGADIIDINIGCPAPKVIRTGAAGALLKDLPLAERIIASVVRSVGIPVTVKTRKGWDSTCETAVRLAQIAEQAGAAMITVHGRTVKQGFRGISDWGTIRRVKEAVRIPVVGNGDVRKPEDAAMMFEQTGCDAVMIGRAALGNPWIFRKILNYLYAGVVESGKSACDPDVGERLSVAWRHASLLVAVLGEERAIRELRGQLGWYIKGIHGAPHIRDRLARASTMTEIKEIFDEAGHKYKPRLIERRQESCSKPSR